MEQDYTIDQVAEIFQVHRKTVEDYINSGELEAYTLRRRKRITPEAVRKFRSARQVKPQQAQNQAKSGELALAG